MSKDISKFSLVEIFNNNNGKSSSTKAVGVLTSFVCLFLFIILVLFYFFNQSEASIVMLLIDKTTVYFGIAAGLMGVKSVSTAIGGNKIDMDNRRKTRKQNNKTEAEEDNTDEDEL